MKILRPLRERDFALLWGGLTISLIGDGIYLVAVAWQVYDLSNSPEALALVGVAWSVGLALFLLLGGVIGDRHDRRRIMVAADLVRAVALAVIGVLAVTGNLEIWHLIGLVLLYAAGEAFFGPSLGAIVPDLVPADRLVDANALEQFVRQTCLRLIGPAIGGVIVALVGAGDAFLIDAGSFLVSAAMIAAIRTRSIGHHDPTASLRHDLLEGLAYVRSERWLWVSLVAAAFGMLLFLGPMEVLLPYVIRNDLGGGSGAFGLVLAADGVGAIVASVALSQKGLPARYLTVMYVAWAAATIPLVGYAVGSMVWQLMVLSAIHGALMTIGLIIWGTLMQTRVPPEIRGRVRSVDWFVSIGFTPLSFALTGPLAALIGVETTLILAGVLPGVVMLGLFVAYRLWQEETPLDEQDDHLDAGTLPAGIADELIEHVPEALRT